MQNDNQTPTTSIIGQTCSTFKVYFFASYWFFLSNNSNTNVSELPGAEICFQ